MKSKKTRRMIVSLSAAILFGIGAVRIYLWGDITEAVVYGLATVLFLLAAFGYYKDLLR